MFSVSVVYSTKIAFHPTHSCFSRYNGVRGWDILCPMIDDEEGEHQLFYGQRSPDIYSPIDAKFVGRTRLKAVQGMYTECDNNGVVLIGTGKWEQNSSKYLLQTIIVFRVRMNILLLHTPFKKAKFDRRCTVFSGVCFVCFLIHIK
ncbi:hypothetical protein AB6A40_010656 [Gnathostoma spinigerum]|uniref:Uncharacterized protein n=1 Tax=Gnathostoma spinigerum TaxID=75299 RepID=A0ABD6F338_9BILA